MLTAGPITGREFVRAVFEEIGNPPKVSAVGSKTVKALRLFWPLAREDAEVVYQFERPFVVDSSKYARNFEGKATPYREGIRRTVEWYWSKEKALNANSDVHEGERSDRGGG